VMARARELVEASRGAISEDVALAAAIRHLDDPDRKGMRIRYGGACGREEE